MKGDDGGCFAAALAAVRTWGGILEHPAGSAAWNAFGLSTPPRAGGWVNADFEGGWTCCIDQAHYGHPTQKPTWLFASRIDLAPLHWDKAASSISRQRVEQLSKRRRAMTPPGFRDLLIGLVGVPGHEVAHLVIPPGEPGHDSLENLAYLCLNCHRRHDYPAWAAKCRLTRIARKDAARPLLNP